MIATAAGTMLLALLAQDPEFRSLEVRYHVVREHWRGGAEEPEREVARTRLLLTASAFRAGADGSASVYDFDRDVARHLDPGGETYRQTSLLAHVAYLNREFRNRKKIAEGMEAAGVADREPSLRTVELETLLGCASGEPAGIESTLEGDVHEFRVGGEVVVRCRYSEHEVDEAGRAMLGRFLFYRCKLHPTVRRSIARRGRVPARLLYRYRDIGSRHEVELTLAGARESAEGPGPSPDARRRWRQDDPLERVVQRALGVEGAPEAAATPGRLSHSGFVELAESARREGRYVDAVLILVEAGLQTGKQPLEQLAAISRDEKALAATGELFRAMGLVDEDAAQALEQLERIDRSRLARPEALDVFRAEALANSGKQEQARGLLLEVLQRNPFLSGVYKDLGDLYHERFDMQRAWLCWDTGRALAPDHPLFEPVRRYERQLQERFHDVL